ncbi:RSP_7527 family protein [Pseudothauera lacus]|uniref:Uncharacterized protein n=1 Tax=Pseudothauera lacus TaxID=2136175 RepID=A0A2T4IDC2_9RHOO|nr:hypothetical protein [Pseudothauera lacus]PTD95760.1 hypothetical protein C8261_12205 [Pseudothauera lacus]
MDHEHIDIDIDERIRAAHRLRDAAVAEFFTVLWRTLRTLPARTVHAVSVQLRAHHLLHH